MICGLGITCVTTNLVGTRVNFIIASVINYLFVYLNVHILVRFFSDFVSFVHLDYLHVLLIFRIL